MSARTMRAWLRVPLLALALALSAPAVQAQATATDAPLQFTDSAEERRFQHLIAELRCVMCQNQSLADSNAMIARDLRREVLDLMRQGKSDREIKDFLVARYGEFVLYRPQVESKTWLLWFGPALVLLGGGLLIGRILSKRGRPGPAAANDDQEW